MNWLKKCIQSVKNSAVTFVKKVKESAVEGIKSTRDFSVTCINKIHKHFIVKSLITITIVGTLYFIHPLASMIFSVSVISLNTILRMIKNRFINHPERAKQEAQKAQEKFESEKIKNELHAKLQRQEAINKSKKELIKQLKDDDERELELILTSNQNNHARTSNNNEASSSQGARRRARPL